MRPHITFRHEVGKSDLESIKRLVERAGVFSQAEVNIAIELAEARIGKGDASDYFFVLAEAQARLAGFTCFGPIPATEGRFDIYWIVVDKSEERRGLGGALLLATEKRCAAAGGKRIYVETSSTAPYGPARSFYEKHGYALEAQLADYHRDGDGLCIYLKAINSP